LIGFISFDGKVSTRSIEFKNWKSIDRLDPKTERSDGIAADIVKQICKINVLIGAVNGQRGIELPCPGRRACVDIGGGIILGWGIVSDGGIGGTVIEFILCECGFDRR